jgi:hypothetical protein
MICQLGGVYCQRAEANPAQAIPAAKANAAQNSGWDSTRPAGGFGTGATVGAAAAKAQESV